MQHPKFYSFTFYTLTGAVKISLDSYWTSEPLTANIKATVIKSDAEWVNNVITKQSYIQVQGTVEECIKMLSNYGYHQLAHHLMETLI
jgi:chorismate mutase